MACVGTVLRLVEWPLPPGVDEGVPADVGAYVRRSEVASRSGVGGTCVSSPPRAAGWDRPLQRLYCLPVVGESASCPAVFARGPAGCFVGVHSCGERCSACVCAHHTAGHAGNLYEGDRGVLFDSEVGPPPSSPWLAVMVILLVLFCAACIGVWHFVSGDSRHFCTCGDCLSVSTHAPMRSGPRGSPGTRGLSRLPALFGFSLGSNMGPPSVCVQGFRHLHSFPRPLQFPYPTLRSAMVAAAVHDCWYCTCLVVVGVSPPTTWIAAILYFLPPPCCPCLTSLY